MTWAPVIPTWVLRNTLTIESPWPWPLISLLSSPETPAGIEPQISLTSHSQVHLVGMRVLEEVGRQLEHLNRRPQFHVLKDIVHNWVMWNRFQLYYRLHSARTFNSGLTEYRTTDCSSRVIRGHSRADVYARWWSNSEYFDRYTTSCNERKQISGVYKCPTMEVAVLICAHIPIGIQQQHNPATNIPIRIGGLQGEVLFCYLTIYLLIQYYKNATHNIVMVH